MLENLLNGLDECIENWSTLKAQTFTNFGCFRESL